MKILFWDIDGTLMRTAKAGIFAFHDAVLATLNLDVDFSSIHTAGQTDCSIARDIYLTYIGREPSATEIGRLLNSYQSMLPPHLKAREGFLLPNIRAILEHFHLRGDYRSLLLTGNIETGARAKVERYDIAQFFDFTASAFGDNCPDRLTLAARAWHTIRQHHPDITAAEIYVIGDTPNDILCGKSIGANTIAVATGNFSLRELMQHQPWAAFEELPPPEEFEKRLTAIAAR